jgi:hypothetical protein
VNKLTRRNVASLATALVLACGSLAQACASDGSDPGPKPFHPLAPDTATAADASADTAADTAADSPTDSGADSDASDAADADGG